MFHLDNFYPPSVKDVLDPTIKFKPATLRLMREFKRSKPWRGTPAQREEKFTKLIKELSSIYKIKPPTLDFTGAKIGGDSSSSYYSPVFRSIFLSSYSLVTLLHEFRHAMRKGEWEACRWSINLFRRIWPKQFMKCRVEGHMLRRDPKA